MVSEIYEGTTEKQAFLIFEKDADLIPVEVFFENDDEEACDTLLLTSSQLDLLRKIGRIEINLEKYKIQEIKPCWITDEDKFYYVIETSKEDDFVAQSI